jgi:MFS family permease
VTREASSADPPVWRNGPFLRLWVAQGLTQTAQNAIWYALLVIVEQATQSTTQLGITILSVIVPSALFGIPAGAYVDRWDKRTVLMVTNLARAVVALGYVAFHDTLGMLYAVSFVFSVITQFFAPAETAIIPFLVGRSRLLQANSMFNLTFTASQLLGLVFFGPLIVKAMGTTSFFFLMSVIYLVSGLLVWRLPAEPDDADVVLASRREAAGHQNWGPDPYTPPRRRSLRSGVNPGGELMGQLREVWMLLRSDREMLWAMGYLTLGSTLTLVVAMLAPRFVVTLGIQAEDAVFVMAPAGIGMLGAAFIFSRASASLLADRGRIISAGLVDVSLSLGVVAGLPAMGRLLGALPPEGSQLGALTQGDAAIVGGVMLAALFAGCGFAAIVVASQTVLQERAPEQARGRVFAVQLTLGNIFSIIPLLLIGGLADVIGVSRVLILIAVLIMVVAFISRRRGAETHPALGTS